MHVTNWAGAQREDPKFWALCWIGWRHRNRQIWRYFWQNTPPVKKVTWSYVINRISWFIRGPCTCHSMPKGETKNLLLFVVTKALSVAAPWMGATKMQAIKGVIKPCPCCENMFLVDENGWPNAEVPKVLHTLLAVWQQVDQGMPLHPILSTTPMDLLHVDFTSVEMTMEPNWQPKVTNVLVFQDHFMKHMSWLTWHPTRLQKQLPSFCVRLHLDLWGPSQAPTWLQCELHEQHY